MLLRSVLIAFVVLFVSCTTHRQEPPTQQFSLMTYNVENLFDAQDDAGKNDETYLPLKSKTSSTHRKSCSRIPVKKWKQQCLEWDWSPQVVETKMQRLAEVVRQSNSGQGPDILVLQEVENINVLDQWRNEYLGELGYQTRVLIEGQDARGIDVAILSRFPIEGEPILHPIPLNDISDKQKKDTRGILQTTLKLPDSELLTVFAVHFPAPFHPMHLRRQALQFLNHLENKLPKGRFAIAAGDFNIPSEEEREHQLMAREAGSNWVVAHKIKCQPPCVGTTYYPPKKSWSFLDQIIINHELLNAAWSLTQTEVVQVTAEQTAKDGTPNEFSLPEQNGVSDHWPLLVRFRKN